MSVSLTRFANGKTALALILISSMVLGVVAVKPAAASGDFWTSKAPMHTARNGLGVAVVDGKIYAIGGSTESGENVNMGGFLGTNEEYDPATDKWTIKAPMPTPRSYLAVTAYQGKIYCLGGIIAYDLKTGITITTVNEVYDPATDTWTVETSLPTPRVGRQASVVGDRIYLIDINSVYHPATDSWDTMSSIPLGVISDVSAVFDNKIYFADANEAKTEIYDTQTGNWSFGAPPPSAVYQGAAAATNGALAPIRIYFLGLIGFMNQGSMPNRVYDPKTGSWTLGAEVPTNRKGFAVAIVNDIIYTIGGYSSTFPYPGDAIEIKTQSAANEAYTPIGYGTPDPDYEPPTPAPTPSLSASPTPSPEPQQPTQFPAEWVVAIAVSVIVVSAGGLVYVRKRNVKRD